MKDVYCYCPVFSSTVETTQLEKRQRYFHHEELQHDMQEILVVSWSRLQSQISLSSSVCGNIYIHGGYRR